MQEQQTSTELTTLPPAERAAVALGSSKAEAQLRELVEKCAVITTVIDPAGREEAHRAGMTLKNARIAIEKTGKAAREDATAFSQAVIAEEKKLKAITEAEEKRVFGLRDAFDAKVAAEKAEAERKERERISAIRTKIDAIRQIPATMAGEPSDEIAAEIAALRAFVPGQDFAEFESDVGAAILGALEALSALHAHAIGREREAEHLAAERAELERLRAVAAEEERKARELREAEEARARTIREEEERRLAEERQKFEDERRAFMLEQANARRQEEESKPAMFSMTVFKENGDPIMLNPDGSRSIFCDVDEGGDPDAAELADLGTIEVASGPDLNISVDMTTGAVTTEPIDAEAVQHFRDIVQELLATRTSDDIRYLLEEEFAKVGLSNWMAA